MLLAADSWQKIAEFDDHDCLVRVGTQPCVDPLMYRTSRSSNPSKPLDETMAKMTSAKLEDGDVKGAVHLLCADDSLAAENQSTFDELGLAYTHQLQPTVVLHRLLSTCRHSKSPLRQARLLSSSSRMVQQLDQTVSDLSTLKTCCWVLPLLSATTDLINLLLAGRTLASVHGVLFGANLLAIALPC